MDKQRRKKNRLNDYDYSTPGAYFITICTDKRKYLFWEDIQTPIQRASDVKLSELGSFLDQTLRKISDHYPGIFLDHYVIMPNHVHLLLRISYEKENTSPVFIPKVIQQMKGIVTKYAGHTVWQKDYHDHIIRDQNDYSLRWNYIDGNPSRWNEDEICMVTHMEW